jgi:hypothetical protein
MFKIIARIQKMIKNLIRLKPIPIQTIKFGKKLIAASVINVFFDSLFREDKTTMTIIQEFKISHKGIMENSKFREFAAINITNSNINISEAISDIFRFMRSCHFRNLVH